jgi:hypothetical protein
MTEETFHIAEYDQFAAKLEELKEYSNHIPDVSTTEGYEKAKRVSLDIRKVEIAIDKVRVDKKSFFLKGGKEVDEQAKALTGIIEAYRMPHHEAYKKLDAEKKEREEKRKSDLSDRVEYIRTLPEVMAESSSDEIQAAMQEMQAEECGDFYEFSSEALKARNATRESLGALYVKVKQSEQDAAELAKLKKEQAERDQKDREDRIAREAKEEAEAATKAAEEKANQAILDAEQAKENARLAAEKAEADKIEAERLAKEQAEIAAENARLAEVKRQEDIVKADLKALEEREANKAHIGRILKATKESIMALGIDEATAKTITLAIKNGAIENVTIKI